MNVFGVIPVVKGAVTNSSIGAASTKWRSSMMR